MKVFTILAFLGLAIAIPPACFLSCINEVSKTCPKEHIDMKCLCDSEKSVIGCLVDICPYGTFISARDHFLGTCMEHGKPSKSNPNPPKSIVQQHEFNQRNHGAKVQNKPTPSIKMPAKSENHDYTIPQYEKPKNEAPDDSYKRVVDSSNGKVTYEGFKNYLAINEPVPKKITASRGHITTPSTTLIMQSPGLGSSGGVEDFSKNSHSALVVSRQSPLRPPKTKSRSSTAATPRYRPAGSRNQIGRPFRG